MGPGKEWVLHNDCIIIGIVTQAIDLQLGSEKQVEPN